MKWFPLITPIHIGREPREREWSREKQPKKAKKKSKTTAKTTAILSITMLNRQEALSGCRKWPMNF